jgi:hypothetical protein
VTAGGGVGKREGDLRALENEGAVQGRRPPQHLKGFMMAHHIRSSRLETRTARLRLPRRLKPHAFVNISPGVGLGYRRCQSDGRWVVRVADGHGGYWTKAFALADDYEDADGDRILTFWQAQHQARAVARGENGASGRPFEDARRKFLAFVEQGIEPACLPLSPLSSERRSALCWRLDCAGGQTAHALQARGLALRNSSNRR